MQWLPTDEQVIERLRFWQRRRRMVGVAMLVIGIAVVGGALYEVRKLHEQSVAIFAELDREAAPTTKTFEETMDQTQFNTGLMLGFLLATGLSAGASLAVTGLVCVITQNRKDRLLLQCWDDTMKSR
ncbi:MAG TPA: hypothetical protein VGN72_20430 [Tepidisphaeraceae bacterium]|jgi:small basic protein|nr:hypothetical protein [Tepidisphaeraceae bacterium]